MKSDSKLDEKSVRLSDTALSNEKLNMTLLAIIH